MSSLETVRTIVQTMQSLGPEILDKAPAIHEEVKRLYSILPKMVIGGDQSVGKSALINRLMPECVQGKVALRSLPGTCTLSTTTIAFVASKSLSITITARGSEDKWTPDSGDATSWLAGKLGKIQQDEAVAKSFFQFETSIVIKHPEITVDYALIDMPGLRSGRAEGEQIDAEFERLIRDADLFLAVDLATRDADNWAIVKPGTLMKLKPGAKTIFVMAQADGINNPETLPDKLAILEARSDIHKYVLTYTGDKHDEASVLSEKTIHLTMDQSQKYVSGTAALRVELEEFYRQLVASKYPEALEAAHGLVSELRAHIGEIKPGMSDKSGVELITLSKTLIVEPACFAHNSDLTVLAANAMKSCDKPYDRKWLERTFAEEGGAKGQELVKYVVDKTAEIRQGRVPGTEGMYNYLLTAYEILGNEVLLTPCKQTLKEKFVAMKSETIKALQERAKSNRQFKKIVDTYCKCIASLSVDTAVATLDKFLKEHQPTSDKGYPHNYAAKLVMEQLRNVLAQSTESGSLEKLQHAMQEPMVHLEALSLNSEYIVQENAKNVILWYWEEVFSRLLIVEMRKLVGTFHSSIESAINKCQADMSAASVKDADMFKSPVDPADQKTLDALESALASLLQVAGADAMMTPGVARVNSATVAGSDQPSSLRAGFHRLKFW